MLSRPRFATLFAFLLIVTVLLLAPAQSQARERFPRIRHAIRGTVSYVLDLSRAVGQGSPYRLVAGSILSGQRPTQIVGQPIGQPVFGRPLPGCASCGTSR